MPYLRRDRAATLVQTALLNVNGDPYVELPVKDALFSGRLKIALDRSSFPWNFRFEIWIIWILDEHYSCRAEKFVRVWICLSLYCSWFAWICISSFEKN